MNKKDRYRMTQEIAAIRQLQWNKAQQRAMDAHRHATEAETDADRAQQKAAAYASLARQALTGMPTLSPELISGLAHAANHARGDVQRCREATAHAHSQWRQQMEQLQRSETQKHDAERMKDRAKHACRRQLEEKQASAAEEQWLARKLADTRVGCHESACSPLARRPGEGRGPMTLSSHKTPGPGLRRGDDEEATFIIKDAVQRHECWSANPNMAHTRHNLGFDLPAGTQRGKP